MREKEGNNTIKNQDNFNINARDIALKIVNDVIIKGAFINIATDKLLSRLDIDSQQRKFATSLAYGTIRMWKRLDWQLNFYCKNKLGKLPPIIANILRLAVFQLIAMPSVPESAAVNEAVKLSKKYGHKGTVALVNGTLRTLLRHPEFVKWPKKDDDRVKWASLEYCLPEWLVSMLYKQWSESVAEEYMQSINLPAQLSARVNTLVENREIVLEKLSNIGVEVSVHQYLPEAITVHQLSSFKNIVKLFSDSLYWQAIGSQAIAHALNPQPGEFVIDMCAAPGGKTTHMAALMKNQGKIIALDIHPHKIELINENAKKLGVSIIESHCIDATILQTVWQDKADKVLLDVPCSGLGVIGHKADMRWRLCENDVLMLPELQYKLLCRADEYLKDGGTILYSTCTLLANENETLIQRFLNEYPNYQIVELPILLRQWIKIDNNGFGKIWPQAIDGSGFFMALLKKNA